MKIKAKRLELERHGVRTILFRIKLGAPIIIKTQSAGCNTDDTAKKRCGARIQTSQSSFTSSARRSRKT